MTGLRVDSDELITSRGERPSAATDAYWKIRQMIVTGRLRPGQFINEQDLVDHLGVGRTPIREAIQRLAIQGLVEIFPRRGVAVARLGLDDIQAVFEARETIEETTAQLAAQRRSNDEAQRLLALGEQIRNVSSSGDYSAFLDIDQKLHHLIASAARNRILADIADHLLMLSNWIWHQYFLLNRASSSNYFVHDLIIEAIVNGDPDGARQAMHDHVQQSRELIRSAM